jgi:ABC-type transport system substrate-binding protein
MRSKLTLKSTALAAALASVAMTGPATALASSQTQASTSAVSTTQTVNWQIALKPGTAYPTATGSAQYQAQPGQREFQLEVDHIKALAGQSVQILVNGTAIGQAKVSSLGIAQFDRNTELGQKVPYIVHGSTVSVRTSADTLVASGAF